MIFAELSPDSKQLLAGFTAGGDDNDGYDVSLWDVTTGKKVRDFRENDLPFQSASFSSDGKSVLAQGREQCVLWETATGRLLQSFPGKQPAINPDGSKVLTFVSDTEAVLWDVATRRRLQSFPARLGRALFHPDQRWVAIHDSAGIRLWDLNSGREIAKLTNFDSGHEWLITTPDGFYTGSPEGRKRVTWRENNRMLPEAKHAAEFHRPELVVRALQQQSRRADSVPAEADADGQPR